MKFETKVKIILTIGVPLALVYYYFLITLFYRYVLKPLLEFGGRF